MSITKQVILLPIILSIVIFASLIYIVSGELTSLIDSFSKDSLRQAKGIISENIKYLTDLTDMGRILSNNDQLARAVKEKNVAKVREIAVRLVKEYPLDFVTVAGVDGIILARGHMEKAGDSMADKENFKAAMRGKPITAIESGSEVKVSVRCGVPLYLDGKIVGVAAVGKNIATNEFVDDLKSEMEVEVTIFFGKTRVATTILKGDGSRAVGTALDDEMADLILNKGETYFGNNSILGKRYSSVYWPIEDVNQKRIGIFFAGREMSKIDGQARAITEHIAYIGSGIVFVAIILGLLFSAKVGRSIQSRDHWYRQILDTVRSPIIVTDLKAAPTLVNAAASQYHNAAQLVSATAGGSNSELGKVGKNVFDHLQAHGDGTLETELQGRSFEADTHYLHDQKGRKNAMFSLFNDIHDRREMEKLVENISDVAQQVRQGSVQISSASQTLSQNSLSQAGELSAVNQAMNELSQQSVKSADDLHIATQLAEDARSASDEGNIRMKKMIESMQRITASAKDIQKINKIIDDIAFQTNLLALNAAVEAARAGRHGKGFAVVAEEVRNLAARSAKAAQETSEKIESTVNQINQGSQIAQDTATALSTITGHATKVADLTNEVTETGRLQNEKIGQIAENLKRIDASTQSNAAGAEETAAAASELYRMADDLASLTHNSSEPLELETNAPPLRLPLDIG